MANFSSGLTGTGEMISTTDGFGGVDNYARGATSDGTNAYHFGRTQGYTLNTETGVSTASGSARSGSGTIRGAAYHNDQVIVYADNRNIYTWTPGTGFSSTALISNLRYASGQGLTGTPNINSIENHNGVLYVVDGTNDGLYSVATNGEMTRIGSGFTNRNISGLVSYDESLLASDNTNDRLVCLDTTDGTLENISNNPMPTSRTLDFLLAHIDELYGGVFSEGLLRFYNIRWNDDIADIVVEEETASLDTDLTTLSTDADTFSFSTGYTSPSWLSISGDNLRITDAPAVDSDENHDVEVTATRDGIDVEQTLRIVVQNEIRSRLTGTGERIGTATQFGASISFPRGLASDGTTVWLFNANHGHTLNVSTGVATRINMSSSNLGTLRSATYHNDQLLVYSHTSRRILSVNTSTGASSNWTISQIAYPAGSGLTGTPDLWGITSLNDTLYVIDRTNDILFTLAQIGSLVRVGTATQFGLSLGNIRAFGTYKDELIAVNDDVLVRINASTGVATRIHATNTVPDTAPEALVEFDDNLYLAGSGTDALFRLYDLLWDDTIDDLEVNEATNETWELADISQDAASFSLQDSPPSWLSVSGTGLVATNAPAVDSDTDYDVTVRATRDSVTADETLRVVVRNVETAAITATISTDDTDIRAGEVVDIDFVFSESVTGFTASDITVSGGTRGALTGSGTDYTLSVTAGSAGTMTVSIEADVVTEGNSAASQDFTVNALPTVAITSSDSDIYVNEEFTVTFEWSESVSGFTTGDVAVTGATKGTFTSVDSDTYTLVLTADSTAGDIDITVASSAVSLGNAETEETFTSSATTAPQGSTDLSVVVTENTATLTWTDGDDGGSAITDHDYRVNQGDTAGGTWIATGSTDTEYTITNLNSNTEYTFQTRAVNAIGDGAASNDVTRTTSISTTLAIEAIDEQNIIIGTEDYELEIDIYNGTENTEFEVVGIWEGFYYDWDHANDILYIRGAEITTLLTGAEWEITATEGSDTATRTIVFNVISTAPVIADPGTLEIIRGVDSELNVDISNNPSSLSVDGVQVGHKFEGGEAGINLIGMLPVANANITVDNIDVDVVASNDGGEHTRTVSIDIAQPVVMYAFRDDTDEVYCIQIEASLLWTYDGLPSASFEVPISSSDNGIFLFRADTNEVYKIDAAQSVWTYSSLPSGTYDNVIASADGGCFMFRDDTDNIYKIDTDGTLEWTFTGLPTASYDPPKASFDGGCFMFNDDTDNIYKIDTDGTLEWTYTGLPSGAYDPIVPSLTEASCFIFSDGTDNIYKIDSDGTLDWTKTSLQSASYNPIVASSLGGVFVLRQGNSQFFHFRGTNGSQSGFYSSLPSTATFDSIMTASSDGNVFLFREDTDDIYKLTSTGFLSWTYTGLPSGTYDNVIASADGGCFIFSDGDDIYKIDSNGNLVWTNTDLPTANYDNLVHIPIIFN